MRIVCIISIVGGIILVNVQQHIVKAVFSIARQIWIAERLVDSLSGGARDRSC